MDFFEMLERQDEAIAMAVEALAPFYGANQVEAAGYGMLAKREPEVLPPCAFCGRPADVGGPDGSACGPCLDSIQYSQGL